MELIRFQSVSDFLIVDFFFTLRRLSERYYSANFLCFGMGNCHDLSSEQAQGEKTRFAVIITIIQNSQDFTGKDFSNVYEVKAMTL